MVSVLMAEVLLYIYDAGVGEVRHPDSAWDVGSIRTYRSANLRITTGELLERATGLTCIAMLTYCQGRRACQEGLDSWRIQL